MAMALFHDHKEEEGHLKICCLGMWYVNGIGEVIYGRGGIGQYA